MIEYSSRHLEHLSISFYYILAGFHYGVVIFTMIILTGYIVQGKSVKKIIPSKLSGKRYPIIVEVILYLLLFIVGFIPIVNLLLMKRIFKTI